MEINFDKEKLQIISNYFGLENQKLKLIEESSELIKELAKNNNQEHILEEMSYTLIVLYQYILLTKSNNKINKIIKYKINRTIERIKNGYY